jgi:hypothetical protein
MELNPKKNAYVEKASLAEDIQLVWIQCLLMPSGEVICNGETVLVSITF